MIDKISGIIAKNPDLKSEPDLRNVREDKAKKLLDLYLALTPELNINEINRYTRPAIRKFYNLETPLASIIR